MSFLSSLFKKTAPYDLTGFTDWHCHILPGVDDGVKTMEQSLSILDRYERAGIKEVWRTPHIMEDVPNETSALRKRFDELKAAYNGDITLHLAAENMIDQIFSERLEKNDVLPIGNDGNMLLVETSYFSSPMNFYEILEEIKAKGYFPLLAHPERYNYIDSISTYRKLKGMEVRFQLNLMSLCGHYGPVVKEKAEKLLSEGMYDLSGTDLHRTEHLDIIKQMRLGKSKLEAIPN